MSEAARTTIDQAEVDRFSAMAAEWWDPTGKFKPLHKFNPVRLTYIRDLASANFGRDPRAHKPLGQFYTKLRSRMGTRAKCHTRLNTQNHLVQLLIGCGQMLFP